MASCKNCGVNVGCGCQLINGLCTSCNSAVRRVKQNFKYVISKTYELCRLF